MRIKIWQAMTNEWNLNTLKRGYYKGYSSSNRPGTLQSTFVTVLSILPLIIFENHSQKNLDGAVNHKLPKHSESKINDNRKQ